MSDTTEQAISKLRADYESALRAYQANAGSAGRVAEGFYIMLFVWLVAAFSWHHHPWNVHVVTATSIAYTIISLRSIKRSERLRKAFFDAQEKLAFALEARNKESQE